MDRMQKLESLAIDIPNKIFEINGKPFGDYCTEVTINFFNGEWRVFISGRTNYYEKFDVLGNKLNQSSPYDRAVESFSDLEKRMNRLEEEVKNQFGVDFSEPKTREIAGEKMQQLRDWVSKLPNYPEDLAYIGMYQNIQSLYMREKYKLVIHLCNILLKEGREH